MVLCVGPTGSRQDHHAALGARATSTCRERKIWTAEDPVEITQPGLRQVQVNPKIDWTFAKALRAFLRADPDVIMVGEIRDEETAQMAIEASLTGHLVLSTLHTNSAPETVTRLLDMGMDPFNFADSLLAVLAQRLVRRSCPHCRDAAGRRATTRSRSCSATTCTPSATSRRCRARDGARRLDARAMRPTAALMLPQAARAASRATTPASRAAPASTS